MTDSRKLLTSSNLCEYLQCSRSGLWKLRQESDFPKPIRFLNSSQSNLRWYQDEIEEWLNSKREEN